MESPLVEVPPKPSDALESVLGPWAPLAERAVSALEKLSDDPVIDVPVKPPVCPNCQKLNPAVRVQESEANGPLFEFVIMCHCLSCNSTFFAIPESWTCVSDVEQVKQVISERAELSGFNKE